jgi:hypothetical protein
MMANECGGTQSTKTTETTLRELMLLASSAEIWNSYQTNAGKLPASMPD